MLALNAPMETNNSEGSNRSVKPQSFHLIITIILTQHERGINLSHSDNGEPY